MRKINIKPFNENELQLILISKNSQTISEQQIDRENFKKSSHNSKLIKNVD